MRRLLAFTLGSALAAGAIAPAAAAQGLQDAAVITAPHVTQYTFGTGAAKRTVSQVSVPLVVVLPFTEKFSVDIATAFASSGVRSGGALVSTISGLTDTQIRANYAIGTDFVILTLGVNVPTGQYTIPEERQAAAGQIGNDFLNYPISSMGNGFAATGGVAFARPLGRWNFGAGASMRKSAEFTPFVVNSADFRFEPADEIRLRVGLDRPVGDGQVALGFTYSAFGEDFADTTTYSTGDRLIATGSWSFPVRSATVFLSGWNLYRLAGKQLGGDAPQENVANLNAAVSFDVGRVLVQPNAEVRLWQADGARAGRLINANARLRIGAGLLSFYPSIGYSVGTIWETSGPSAGAATDVTGLRGSLTIRVN
jgi:hypothetical protein